METKAISKNFKVFGKLLKYEEFVDNIKLVYMYGYLGTEILVLTKNDCVFAFGCNELCLQVDNNANQLIKVEELCDKEVIKFDSGFGSFGAHVLALTSNGSVYSWGINTWGQLGNGTRFSNYTPMLVKNLPPISDICCGGYHTLALTQDHEVYAFGYNFFGQIGNESKVNQLSPLLVKIPESPKVIAIACGYYHSLALTESGKLFGWGSNEFSQLGVGCSVIKLNTPTNIPVFGKDVIIKKVTCGSLHTLLLSSDGDLFAFGWNRYGQIGLSVGEFSEYPVKVNTCLKFVDIFSSNHSDMSIAVSLCGKCFLWGKCGRNAIRQPIDTGLSSIGKVCAIYWYPILSYDSSGVTLIPCGKYKHELKEALDLMCDINNNYSYFDMYCEKFRNFFKRLSCFKSQNTGICHV